MNRRAKAVRDSFISNLRKQGFVHEELAMGFGVSITTISIALRRTDTLLGGQGPQSPVVARHKEIEADYRSGMTLEAIGMKMGVTRERIRQILRKNGVEPTDGGKHVVGMIRGRQQQINNAERKEQHDAHAMKWFGCSHDEAVRINDGLSSFRTKGTKTSAYLDQSRNSATRQIAFKLTLPEWWDVWERSGQWENRGRGRGKFCMSRIGDVGGYEVGNVEIVGFVQNCQDFYFHVNRRVRDELDLTPRQRTVYDLLLAGLNPKAVSAQTGLKYSAATSYICNLRKRFPELRQSV